MKMNSAIPTLGYPTRYQAVVALKAKGLKPRQIADEIGTSVDAVYQHLTYAKRGRSCRTPWRLTGRTTVILGKRTTHSLTEAAEQRGLSVAALCRRLLNAAAEENLIDAILDDRMEAAE